MHQVTALLRIVTTVSKVEEESTVFQVTSDVDNEYHVKGECPHRCREALITWSFPFEESLEGADDSIFPAPVQRQSYNPDMAADKVDRMPTLPDRRCRQRKADVLTIGEYCTHMNSRRTLAVGVTDCPTDEQPVRLDTCPSL
jgi:hypothetical protein